MDFQTKFTLSQTKTAIPDGRYGCHQSHPMEDVTVIRWTQGSFCRPRAYIIPHFLKNNAPNVICAEKRTKKNSRYLLVGTTAPLEYTFIQQVPQAVYPNPL